jgi:hypothetical protein
LADLYGRSTYHIPAVLVTQRLALVSVAVQAQVSNSQWSAREESKMERGGVIFRSQEQLREMCCIDHKLEHLLRGSRVFRYVFCFDRKAAKLHVFCGNDAEV